MDGMTKLRYGLTGMLILLTVSLVSSYFVSNAEDEAAINAFEKLDLDEMEAVIKYSDLQPDITGMYLVLGLLIYAVEIGLIIATWKVWHAKKILGTPSRPKKGKKRK